jgi:16S rRNA (cytosine1402-N4)-methyltransferase
LYEMSYAHRPVMPQEVLEILGPRSPGRYLDATLGGGGHAEAILDESSPAGELLGLDWDADAIMASEKRLARFGRRVTIRRANFTEAGRFLEELEWRRVNGAVVDLGMSSHHVNEPGRGFSFESDARLDMRMDSRNPVDAYQLVNTLPVKELERILRDWGEERQSRRIAAAIDSQRRLRAIESPRELATIVAKTIGWGERRARSRRRASIHPATRTFQALRIAVNHELENLENFLEDAYDLLLAGGRLVVISFHSLEDRLVKRAFQKWSRDCLCPPRTPVCVCGWTRKVVMVTRKPRVATPAETTTNPRARSAKLRAVERI